MSGSDNEEEDPERKRRKVSEKEEEKEEEKKEQDDDDDDDGWVGPLPSEAAPTKKQRVLEFESLYLDSLPKAEGYERSYMHRDTVTHVAVTPSTDFIVTASVDGHVKFWKKQQNAKIFDIVNFDMINMRKLGYAPECCQWIHRAGDAICALAVAESEEARIHVYDGRGDPTTPAMHVLDRMHTRPATVIAYNPVFDVVVSSDQSGMVEYWSGVKGDYVSPPRNVMFQSKIETDLFDFAKNKTYPLNITVSPNGKFLASFGADKKVRIFRFLSGKLYCVIDESISHYVEMQQAKQMFPTMDFNRKVSTERDLEKADLLRHNNVVFDKTSNFVVYASMAGIKVANIYTNKGVRILGRSENMRFLNVSLFQGLIRSFTSATTAEIQGSENPQLDSGVCDPTLVATALKKNRFYLFSRREPRDTSNVDADRDVFNEKPSKEDIIAAATEEKGAARLYDTATIHSSLGDIQLQLFPRECPKTVENFCVHARNGYYNGHLFHRVIKQFMIQTGDPTGIGTGGTSIWGGEFEDEFHPKLRHDRPYTVSMANAGPNTNGSQFFVTVVPTPWLDNKHTVFGRVTRGMEIAQNIANAKAHPKSDKPYDDITIISVSVKNPVRL